jgi:thiamine-phosphate pyrophosphorylase
MTSVQQRCQPYLTVSADKLDHGLEAVNAMLERANFPCLLLTAPKTGLYDAFAAGKLMDLCHNHDTAFLIENDLEAAADLRADGLHIAAGTASYDIARARLGSEIQIGTACGFSRHQAMQMAELGADYVAFGDTQPPQTGQPQDPETKDMIAWWSALFEIPCVAWQPIDLDAIRQCRENGADFVALDAAQWFDSDAMADGLAGLFGPSADNDARRAS